MMTTNVERLRTAEAAAAEAAARRDAISQRLRDLSQVADQRRTDVQQLQQPRQERRGLIAKLLRLGRPASPDERQQLQALDSEMIRAQSGIANAADDLSAIADVEGELQAEANSAHAELPALLAELDDARAAVAGDELEHQAMPEFLAALEAFRAALAKVYGVQHAAMRMSRRAVRNPHAYFGAPDNVPVALGEVSIPLPALDIEARLRGVPDVQVIATNMVILRFADGARRESDAMVDRLSELEGGAIS